MATMPIASPAPVLPPCDISKRYVRICERRDNGFVLFEFSIGWPELVVELMMTQPDFDVFCAANRVIMLPPADSHPETP